MDRELVKDVVWRKCGKWNLSEFISVWYQESCQCGYRVVPEVMSVWIGGGSRSRFSVDRGGAGSRVSLDRDGAGSRVSVDRDGAGSRVSVDRGGAGSRVSVDRGGAGSRVSADRDGAGSRVGVDRDGAGVMSVWTGWCRESCRCG